VNTIAVGFDFDHTLGLDHKLERTAFMTTVRELCARSGRSLDEESATASIDEQISYYRAGKCSLSRAFEEAFEATMQRMSPDGAFARFQSIAMDLSAAHVKAIPGVDHLLARLDGAHVPYAILTNGWNPLQQRKADLIGFSKPVFVSDDIGVRKPSIHAFNILKDYFHVDPNRIWYVGDDPLNDVLGALSAGMRAVWFDWEQHKYPTTIPAPTAIVTKIVDALDLIL
jgi:HAD superfamily hydrolase (TIGR01549 family)